MIKTVISKTIEYVSMPAVVGHEQLFMAALHRDFSALGLSVYPYESALVVSGNTPHSAIISAHLDRHGLMSIGNDEYVYAAQYIKEIKYGENNRLAEQQLESIARRFEGEKVYAYDPENGRVLGSGVIEACNPHMLGGDALFFIDDMPTIRSGMPLAYARPASYEHAHLKGQIDNAISLAVIYALFEQGFQGTAILTTEEEIGKSWLHIQSCLDVQQIETQSLLVLDTSPYADKTVIDKGALVFRARDMSGVFTSALVEALQARATDLGLPFETKDQAMLAAGKTVAQLGSTELGRLIEGTQGRWNGATVQIPTLMYHTSSETTTDKAIENYCRFLRDILIDNPLALLSVAQDG